MKRSKQKTVKRQPGLPGPRSDDWGEFKRQLRESYESGCGPIRVYAKTSLSMPPCPAKFSLQEVMEEENFLSFLMEEFGNGWYYIIIYGSYGEVVGEYEFLMGEPPSLDSDLEAELEAMMLKHMMKQSESLIDSQTKLVDILLGK